MLLFNCDLCLNNVLFSQEKIKKKLLRIVEKWDFMIWRWIHRLVYIFQNFWLTEICTPYACFYKISLKTRKKFQRVTDHLEKNAFMMADRKSQTGPSRWRGSINSNYHLLQTCLRAFLSMQHVKPWYMKWLLLYRFAENSKWPSWKINLTWPRVLPFIFAPLTHNILNINVTIFFIN